MMGLRTPKTCLSVNKRQDNKLEKLLHRVDDLFELNEPMCPMIGTLVLQCFFISRAASKHFNTAKLHYFVKNKNSPCNILVNVALICR
jgi:hypothetical protein